MPVVDRADRPADDEPREQVEDRRQIQLAALADDELGGVADPAPIRRVGRELPVEQIRRDRLVVIAHRRAFEAFPRPRFQAVLLHQPNDPLAADADLLLEQIFVNARAAVPLLARVERGAHQHPQLPIALGVGRFGPPAPRVVPAGRHPQHLAHRRNRKDRLPRVNQRERVAGSFAKKAAAFFRISRSSRSWRFSFRSCDSSSRSAVVSPVRPLRAIGPRALHPLPERRFGQIEIAGDRADALAFVEDQPDRLGFEVVIEPPAWPPASWWSLPSVWTSYPPFGKMSTKPDQAHLPVLAGVFLEYASITNEPAV